MTLPAETKRSERVGCSSFHIAHPDGTVFVHPTANFIPDALTGHSADVAYLGGGAAGAKPVSWIENYWRETVGALSPSVVRPVHWDAFWRPLTKPLRPLPRRIDRLDLTMREFTRLAGTAAIWPCPRCFGVTYRLLSGVTVQSGRDGVVAARCVGVEPPSPRGPDCPSGQDQALSTQLNATGNQQHSVTLGQILLEGHRFSRRARRSRRSR